MPQGTAAGFPSASPPLPHGSERSTSGFGNNLEPAALPRPSRALFRSSAFSPLFLETQLCSWRCRTGISWPLRVPVGQSVALRRRVLCSEEARKLPPGAGKPVPGVADPALTFLRSFPFPIAASQTRVWDPHGGYGPERPPRGGRSGKWPGRAVWLDLQVRKEQEVLEVGSEALQRLLAFRTGTTGVGGGGERADRERRR